MTLLELPPIPAWQAVLALAPALVAACGTLFAWRSDAAAAWRSARGASALALALAVASLAASGVAGSGQAFGLRADAVGGIVAVLVAFIGWVIVRYSQPYLAGERGEAGYVRWLLATLAAVFVVVTTNHLLVLALAWTATSIALHQLLTFFAERPAALSAAHKKFVLGRVADAAMLGACALLGMSFGTLQIDAMLARAAAADGLPLSAQAAVVLVAVAALLRCAQLPFHGWLIQVMEAPTPVSALLHAGIVNLGGFVLIRLAPLVAEVPPAAGLLVAAGAFTAVTAAMVMTTRVSIKVALAWSTCAQMGFMLLQCGLGAYTLALLHLVAHSLYKAHAFLCAGSVVDQWRAQALLRKGEPAPLGTWLVAPALGVASVAAIAAAFGAHPQQEPALWVAAWIVSLALAPLLTPSLRGGARQLALCGGASLAVVAFYFGWHALFAAVLAPLPHAEPSTLRLAIPIAGFALLYALTAALSAHPRGRLAAWLFPRLFAGFHLDELFTRLTFRLWPVQPRAEHSPAPAVATRSHS
jgi:NAD(P)H-quinone oxidoreductase subunit 5